MPYLECEHSALCFSYFTMLVNFSSHLSQQRPVEEFFFTSVTDINDGLSFASVFFSAFSFFFTLSVTSSLCCSVLSQDWVVVALLVALSVSLGSFLDSSLLSLLGWGWTASWVLLKSSSGTQTFLWPMYSIKLANPAPHWPQLRLSNKDPNLAEVGFWFSLSFPNVSFIFSCLVPFSASWFGSESLLVFALLSELSLLSLSFLLDFGVLGTLAGAGVVGALSRLLIPNSARWAMRHWSNCSTLPWTNIFQS